MRKFLLTFSNEISEDDLKKEISSDYKSEFNASLIEFHGITAIVSFDDNITEDAVALLDGETFDTVNVEEIFDDMVDVSMINSSELVFEASKREVDLIEFEAKRAGLKFSIKRSENYFRVHFNESKETVQKFLSKNDLEQGI